VSAWLEEDFRVRIYTNASDRSQVSSYAMLQNEDDGVNFSSGARILALIIRNFIGEGFGKSGYVRSTKPTSVPRGSLGGDKRDISMSWTNGL